MTGRHGTRWARTAAVGGLVLAVMIAALARAQGPAADLILANGKIITVDDRFTIAQAVAVRGDRILAVGSDADVAAFAATATRRVDLAGRAVIPGLIDNHMHLLRAGTTWQWEVRWDGVESRRAALDMVRARAKAMPPGAWVFNLGGWTIDQFADDSSPFTREELDRIAPDNPVLLQASYYEAYLNTRALEALALTEREADWVERDGRGRPTGRIAEAGIRGLTGGLPQRTAAEVQASTLGMIADLNRAGLTTFGVAGCDDALLETYRAWAARGRLNARVFCLAGVGTGTTRAQVERALPRIAGLKPRLFQGDSYVDHIAYGENVYGPLHDPMFAVASSPEPEQLELWRAIVTEIARAGLPLHVHAELEGTIDAFLDEIEIVNRRYPVRNLRWVLAHVNQLDAAHLARMRELGLYAAVHPWAVINGGINRRLFGDRALDMPALRTIQESGVVWGLGSDGSRANQILPFTTLWWAVTGRMVGGTMALRQPISREDALIAHTRRNAYFVFQENNLGAIQPGKLADLVVLDRDYLTVPADEIKDIRPVMTIVGGRVVYEAAGVLTVEDPRPSEPRPQGRSSP